MLLRPLLTWSAAGLAICAVFGLIFGAVSRLSPVSSSQEEFETLGGGINLSDLLPHLYEPPVQTWVRPPGPLRVGLQAGHWKNGELPDELSNLRERGGGTRGGGKYEWETNLEIAQTAKTLIEKEQIIVDILPATIPPDYWADIFISIHADGSTDTSVSGFKVAAPWRDRTGRGAAFAALLEATYASTTNLRIDPNVTANMRGYYAFNWRKYEHSIHPMTTAVILETGFLTNPSDQRLLIRNQGVAAKAIAEAVFAYLNV
ncbi:N-acetylmuramoyl-L-alanine amidase [Patescibacteria group bacterium]|nr:N-acetylmuramoyl-L-alanine amidase [Patescibacteria group bacterium]